MVYNWFWFDFWKKKHMQHELIRKVKLLAVVSMKWLNDMRNIYPVGKHMLKVSNRNTRSNCEICSKLTIKTPEWSRWYGSGVFIFNFEHISYLDLVFLLLTLSR